jgi:hypothetical protein
MLIEINHFEFSNSNIIIFLSNSNDSCNPLIFVKKEKLLEYEIIML